MGLSAKTNPGSSRARFDGLQDVAADVLEGDEPRLSVLPRFLALFLSCKTKFRDLKSPDLTRNKHGLMTPLFWVMTTIFKGS